MFLKIKRKIGDMVRNTPVICDQPWVFEKLGPTEKTRRYLQSLGFIDKSEKYLEFFKQGFINAYAKNNHDLDKMHKSFRSLRVRSKRLPKDWWENVFMLANTPDVKAETLSRDMINHTRNFDPQVLTVHEWIAIYSLFIRLGLFHIGYIIRDLARKRALNALEPYNKILAEKQLAIAAAIELREFGKAQKALSDLKKTGKYQYYNKAEFILNLFIGADLKEATIEDAKELEFSDYISRKSIAVVGPANADTMNAKEIDAFDRIVRVNYRESGKGCDPDYKGTRCDITYMNGIQAQFFFDNPTFLIPNELSWMILKNAKYINLEIEKANLNVKLRQKKTNNSCIFNGSFNMLQIISIDLLYFNPKRIKIFHSDLMLSVLRFLGYYPSEFDMDDKEKKKVKFCRSAVEHDPVTQYSFLHNLWKAGRIEGDKRFNEVMELGCEEYMRQLQQIYGDSARLGRAEHAAC